MSDNPLLILLAFGLGLVFFYLWFGDYRAARSGQPRPNPLPGAVPANRMILLLGAVGVLILLAIEVAGEYALGIVGEQTTVTWLFALYTLAAAFIEEVIFRGYLFVEKRGRAILWLSVVVFSLLFALLHPHLWSWEAEEGAGLQFHLTIKAFFTTGMLFLSSLWFYWLRFSKFNPGKSLIPCIVAHLVLNLGVFFVKYFQGFVEGLY